jgi:p-cumate 2,3-dioxygenase alpha subunit
VTTPDKEGYGPAFDRSQFSLASPAKVESYRGFFFLNFDANAMSLEDYLAGAREFIDLVADEADEGMRVVAGTNLYSAKANWKLMVENATDTYHVPPLHITFTNYVKSTGGGNVPTGVQARGSLDLGNGHAVTEVPAPWHRPIAHWEPIYGEDARAEIEAIRLRLIDRHGEVRGRRMAETFRLLVIFPNLVINDIAAITIRYMEPVRPDLVSISAWELAPKEESGARLSRRLDSFLTFIGPGGLATPDDIEAVESCQQGYACLDEVSWSDISRGMSGPVRHGNELELRSYWRQWAAAMSGSRPAGNGSQNGTVG